MAYDLKGKFAVVTGGGSGKALLCVGIVVHCSLWPYLTITAGISHTLTKMLLEAGCSVLVADLKLRPESEALLTKYPHPSPSGGPSNVFYQTDVTNWKQLKAMWNNALETFGRVDVVVNGAGIFEPPSSSFWFPPGSSAEAKDDADAEIGQYKTFAVNMVGPIRLAQIAVEYWLKPENKGVAQGNLVWLASMYVGLFFAVSISLSLFPSFFF